MTLGILERNSATTETNLQKRFSYGLEEISALTGLSTAFLRKEARTGNLITKKFGARRLVLAEDLKNYLERTEN
jgi:hypothetical protein